MIVRPTGVTVTPAIGVPMITGRAVARNAGTPGTAAAHVIATDPGIVSGGRAIGTPTVAMVVSVVSVAMVVSVAGIGRIALSGRPVRGVLRVRTVPARVMATAVRAVSVVSVVRVVSVAGIGRIALSGRPVRGVLRVRTVPARVMATAVRAVSAVSVVRVASVTAVTADR
jgi:hypothetical protein